MKKLAFAAITLFALGGGTLLLAVSSSEACCVFGEPPVVMVSASPDQCWPPNHKMVEVLLDVVEVDPDDPPIPFTWAVSNVTYNEIGAGEGDPTNNPDYFFDDQYLELRCERSGIDGGRVYTVTITATNQWGSSTATTTVIVPHDMRDKNN